jgi:uncharacterized protein (DUF4415 family)
MKKPNPELVDKENPEWTDAMFARAKPAKEVFPDLVAHTEKRKRGQRGPQRKPRKVRISLRLDSSVIDAYKAAGRGYQTRMAAILEKNAR